METLGFTSAPFAPGAHPLERKKAHGAVALLEFAPGFEDPSWCARDHVIYVLEGELTVELEGGRRTVSAGDACVLRGAERHRAANAGPLPCRLFVVSASV